MELLCIMAAKTGVPPTSAKIFYTSTTGCETSADLPRRPGAPPQPNRFKSQPRKFARHEAYLSEHAGAMSRTQWVGLSFLSMERGMHSRSTCRRYVAWYVFSAVRAPIVGEVFGFWPRKAFRLEYLQYIDIASTFLRARSSACGTATTATLPPSLRRLPPGPCRECKRHSEASNLRRCGPTVDHLLPNYAAKSGLALTPENIPKHLPCSSLQSASAPTQIK